MRFLHNKSSSRRGVVSTVAQLEPSESRGPAQRRHDRSRLSLTLEPGYTLSLLLLLCFPPHTRKKAAERKGGTQQ
jgi:hypothetical protein